MIRALREPTRRGGFTLVEVMAVVAILALLMSLVLVGAGRYRRKAYEEGTRGLLEKVRSALEEYRAAYSRYPPDGFDSPVYRSVGGGRVQISGARCLLYFLCKPTFKIAEYGDEIVRQELDPFLDINGEMISGAGDLDDRLDDPQNELIDAYGNPIHYDNVERSRDGSVQLSVQMDSSMHTMPDFLADQMHGPDPRGIGGPVMPKNPGQYDLWSHGTDVEDPTDDITNW